MKTLLKHIGLQVTENDVEVFYVDILGFEPIREFQLSKNDSLEIFGIEKEVKIIFGVCCETEFELFVNSSARELSYNLYA